jgi:hypothetical protein
LRVARGLLRLWLVLSVFWVGGIGGVAWLKFPPAVPQFDPTKPYEVVPNYPLSDAEVGLPDAPWVKKTERWDAIKTGAEMALIPPLLILLVGSALGWAIRGFKP